MYEKNPIQNGSNLMFLASWIEAKNFRSTSASESDTIVIFYQSKESANAKDAILAYLCLFCLTIPECQIETANFSKS